MYINFNGLNIKLIIGVDYCAKGHKCHANASCLNLQTTYACHCNIGFQGDGHNCHGILILYNKLIYIFYKYYS